ncbi:MAG: EamA family transporter [Defluviitaleaceae bacterium]|nr:EamA family transporter [Defluviitaleaceae bacterium]
MSQYMLVAFSAVVISSLAQVLLKKSSGEKKKHFLFDYLNLKVCTAYGMIFLCIPLMIYAFTGMYYRYGAVIESLAYLLIMMFSRFFLGERITRRRILGNCMIVLGVFIFAIG